MIKTKTKKKKTTLTRLKPTKNTPAYYQCLALKNQHGLKPSLTKCCQHCKTNSQALATQTNQEIKKLISAYQQVGLSLSKLLNH